jgi:hypothetical protein
LNFSGQASNLATKTPDEIKKALVNSLAAELEKIFKKDSFKCDNYEYVTLAGWQVELGWSPPGLA